MHGGFSRGYGSMIQMAPEHSFAVIVLTNKSGETLNKTTTKAKEMFLPLKSVVVEAPKNAVPPTAADLTAFAGKFVNGPQIWEITATNGKLILKAEGAEFPLSKVANWRLAFGAEFENELVLVPGAAGRAEYMFNGLYSAKRVGANK